jgi:hypothetical protein
LELVETGVMEPHQAFLAVAQPMLVVVVAEAT